MTRDPWARRCAEQWSRRWTAAGERMSAAGDQWRAHHTHTPGERWRRGTWAAVVERGHVNCTLCGCGNEPPRRGPCWRGTSAQHPGRRLRASIGLDPTLVTRHSTVVPPFVGERVSENIVAAMESRWGPAEDSGAPAGSDKMGAAKQKKRDAHEKYKKTQNSPTTAATPTPRRKWIAALP